MGAAARRRGVLGSADDLKSESSRGNPMTRKFGSGWAAQWLAASRRLAYLGVLVAVALMAGRLDASAQMPSASLPGVDPALLEDIVVGSRILADFGVVDGFGHVSARHPTNPNHFLMSRSLAPALVTADDIMEFDLDGNPVDARGLAIFIDRFIHSEIYKARPDVMSVVHTHSPGVIPFSVSKVPLRAMFHNPSFLAVGVPVWDIRKDFGETDMLVSNPALGKSLAQTLGNKPVVLMRGHGDVTVGPSVKMAVFRAYYTDVNAKLQSQAMALGGDVNYLTPGEGEKGDKVNFIVIDRIWNLWKMRVLPTLGK